MKVYEVMLWYMHVYESDWIYMRQHDGIRKYTIVIECKW